MSRKTIIWNSARVALALLLAACRPAWADAAPAPGANPDANPGAASGIETFLAWFWQRPLAEQRAARIFPQEIIHPLAAGTCGLCHGAQYTDWSGSRHALAMGPGAIGQFPAMSWEERQACLDCHAPLYEQSEILARHLDGWEMGGEDGADQPWGVGLHGQGVLCAACHVRAGRWHGPPRRAGLPPLETQVPLPHQGWISHEAFGDSRLCAACHQFPADGFSLNGKPLENTYEEWRASPQARRGISCQGCHMPERRHLFRGIHDPETVRAGAEAGSRGFSAANGEAAVSLFLANTGTGHRLPTYVTPSIHLVVHQQDAAGVPIPGTEQMKEVARRVDLQLTREYFDTRLAPGETAVLDYRRPISPRALALVTGIRVEPDAFYTRIYEALLEMDGEGEGADLIRRALTESRRSGFSLYERRYRLND